MSNSDTKQDYVFGRGYAWYALFVLMLVAAFSLLDRQIVTILALDIKRDLGLSDSELGLLHGTVFAIFYALFGIPVGRLADTWIRTRVLPIGLAGWSLMTIFSGLSNTMGQFGWSRVGVGIGESAAGPAATSLLSDYFPTRLRATVLALYSCGISLGLGASLVVGGAVVTYWNELFPDGNFPWGIKGWQAAFIAVGIPGFFLALLVASLKEPPRGVSEGILQAKVKDPFRRSFDDLMAILPPFTFYNFWLAKVAPAVWYKNLAGLVCVVVAVSGLVWFTNGLVEPTELKVYGEFLGLQITGNTVQWCTVGLGVYCIFSWSQSLERRDAPAYELIFKTPAMLAVIGAGALFMIINNGLMAWAPFLAVQTYNESIGEVGSKFGVTVVVAGFLGTWLGGFLGDKLRKKSPQGRLYVTLIATALPAPLLWLALQQKTLDNFLICFALVSVATTAWLPGMLSTLQDLVLPRMRGLVYAAFTLGMTIIGLGTGPYAAGLVSDISGSLRIGVMSLYAIVPIVWLLLFVGIRFVVSAETSKVARATAAGEVFD